MDDLDVLTPGTFARMWPYGFIVEITAVERGQPLTGKMLDTWESVRIRPSQGFTMVEGSDRSFDCLGFEVVSAEDAVAYAEGLRRMMLTAFQRYDATVEDLKFRHWDAFSKPGS